MQLPDAVIRTSLCHGCGHRAWFVADWAICPSCGREEKATHPQLEDAIGGIVRTLHEPGHPSWQAEYAQAKATLGATIAEMHVAYDVRPSDTWATAARAYRFDDGEYVVRGTTDPVVAKVLALQAEIQDDHYDAADVEVHTHVDRVGWFRFNPCNERSCWDGGSHAWRIGFQRERGRGVWQGVMISHRQTYPNLRRYDRAA